MEEKFEKEILEKIKEKAPKPRWQFLLKDYVIWFLGALSLLIGGLSSSVLIYLLVNGDWAVYGRMDFNWQELVLLFLPYFWIIILGVFVLSAYYYVKHTKKGYQYPIATVVIFSIIASIFLGGCGFVFGLGEAIDNVFGEKAPAYYEFFNPRIRIWREPEKGRLSGLVIRSEQENFYLLDISRQEWKVYLEKKPPFLLEIGCPVKLLGKKIKENEFYAFEILPPGPGQGFLRNACPFEEYNQACQRSLKK
jgi:hypothetical protein